MISSSVSFSTGSTLYFGDEALEDDGLSQLDPQACSSISPVSFVSVACFENEENKFDMPEGFFCMKPNPMKTPDAMQRRKQIINLDAVLNAEGLTTFFFFCHLIEQLLN